jgi:zona occludens toxin
MIELRTGLPGNGKTLSIVQELAAMQAKWDKGCESARPVFVHNIRDLALPHSPLPLDTITHKGGQEQKIPDWSQVPDGAFVIIDEGQDLFPPRSTQSIAPPHVAWLNTHRHRGVDIILSTQHPKLVDGSLRALVGKHKHYRRVFGMQRAIVYEWDGCSDSLSGMKNATTGHFSFPKDAFKWYKSAELHTKQSFKLPLWLGIPIIGLFLGLYFVPKAYGVITNGSKGKGITQQTLDPQASKGAIHQSLPLTPSAPSVLPLQSIPVPVIPVAYVGCISDLKKCQCLTASGTIVVEPAQCRQSSETTGMLVPVNMQSHTVPTNQKQSAVTGQLY